MLNELELIRALSDAFGPSGFEDDVVRIVREQAADLGDIEEDCLRNVYIRRKENKGNRPVIMLDAHGDEVGFMVHSVRPNGLLRFVNIGGWNLNTLSSADVLVRNSLGEYIPGIIAAKPVHFQTAAEKAAGGVSEISALSIDIGACSREEAIRDFHIRIGEPIVPATRLRVDEGKGLLFGKAFDCRIGVAAMLKTLDALRGVELPCDVVAVLSSQEEVGERGAKVAVNRVKPDCAWVFEGTPADDTFTEPYAIQTALRKGPMFRHMDRTVICTPRYMRFVTDLAEREGIPMQTAVREGGGNNGAVILTSLEAVPVVVAGIPVRYIHSMNCIAALEDFRSAVALSVQALRQLTPELIRGF